MSSARSNADKHAEGYASAPQSHERTGDSVRSSANALSAVSSPTKEQMKTDCLSQVAVYGSVDQ